MKLYSNGMEVATKRISSLDCDWVVSTTDEDRNLVKLQLGENEPECETAFSPEEALGVAEALVRIALHLIEERKRDVLGG